MSFASELRAFASKSQQNADLVRRRVAIEIFERVIKRSPVDTGRFRGNWQASVGDYPRSIIEDTDPTGAGASANMVSLVLGDKTNHPLYLVNNLPYSLRLEHGHSQQAPSGMVKVTVSEFQQIVKNTGKQR